jgi:hypothetical protein
MKLIANWEAMDAIIPDYGVKALDMVDLMTDFRLSLDVVY